jgi:hypothetical protein
LTSQGARRSCEAASAEEAIGATEAWSELKDTVELIEMAELEGDIGLVDDVSTRSVSSSIERSGTRSRHCWRAADASNSYMKSTPAPAERKTGLGQHVAAHVQPLASAMDESRAVDFRGRAGGDQINRC